MPDIENEYQEALNYLYSFVDYSLTRQLRYSPEKFNLERMYKFMSLMGNPHKKKPVIHVAGTKGKGSTAAMIASILRVAGYKVGLYTSPHLQDFTERIQVDGVPVSHLELVSQVQKIKEFVVSVPEITTFEITTALAFQVFADARVDVAVVEVGLGGRLDATNIVDPIISVITALSFDHMNILGDTIEQIATEKGGIIKNGKPTILAPQWKEASAVIERICVQRNSPLTVVGRDYLYSQEEHSLLSQSFKVWKQAEIGYSSPHHSDNVPVADETNQYTIPLLGLHQVENAVTAYATIRLIQQNGFEISESDIENGFRKVTWPGRFELIGKNPTIILDSAHNQDSALRLRQTMDENFIGKKVILVFGASEDKDVPGMFEQLLPCAKMVIATESNHPRAMEGNKLVELSVERGKKAIKTDSVEAGIQEALAQADEESVILVTGSIFVVAAARDILQKKD